MRSRNHNDKHASFPSDIKPIQVGGVYPANGRHNPKYSTRHFRFPEEGDYPFCCCCRSRKVMLAAFGFFLSCVYGFLTNTQVSRSMLYLPVTEIESIMNLPVAKVHRNSSVAVAKKPRKWAYTFFLGGVPTIYRNDTAAERAGYRGLLFNILVSVKILQDSGSKADMILMVHMAEPYTSLPDRDTRLLQKLNIKTFYVPPTLPTYINGISTIALEKFRILDFLQYSRVMYMEGDVMPHCNLDYLFDLSDPVLPEKGKKQPLLQENVVISIQGIPATTSIFMLKPWLGHYAIFLNILTNHPAVFEQFNRTKGWGHAFREKIGDTWLSLGDVLSNKTTNKSRNKWNFPGADLDRGLLYHWVRYVRKKVSVVVGPQIVHVVGLNQTIVPNPLRRHSCLSDQKERNGGRGYQVYANAALKQVTSPFGRAPYRDFAQWEFTDNKPWNYERAPDPDLNSSSARRRWFAVLRQLDRDLDIGLGLCNPKAPSVKEGESLHADVPNWKYIPKQKPDQRMPIWSTKVHALKLWAQQQTDSETRELSWQPPLVAVPPDIHRQLLFSQEPTLVPPAKGEVGNNVMPIRCNCSTPIFLDPCSLPDQSMEEWMKYRLGLKFSKYSPACPDAARHHMHVVLPFTNLSLRTLQTAYCSAQCQDYPTNKLTIYMYEDGPEKDASPNSEVLQHICGQDGVLEVRPPVSAAEMTLDSKTDEEFDAASQHWADQVMTGYSKDIEPFKNAVANNTICLHSNGHSGPGGGKYWAFRLVQARAGANDVVVVLDGDDELNTPKALQIINRNYIQRSAWMTYGSFDGKYSEQTKGMPRDILEGKATFNPRQDQPSWRFGHVRTFKAHLLRHVGRKDFTYKDNSWLVKATDRGFVYRMMELSGPDRVEFIPESLYKYKWSSSSSTIATVPKEIRAANLQHVQSLEPSQRLILPIHVVVVCWSRVYLLKEQLVWLQEQTLTENRQLVVHLLSNNPQTHPDLVQTVDGFRKKQDEGSFPDRVQLRVQVVEQKRNWHAFSRFLYIQELRKTEPMDLAIFVDDDQYWVPNFLASLLSHHSPRGMTTWYGKTFRQHNLYTGMADYWTSNIKWTTIVIGNRTDIKTFTYGGPGGSVFDSNIWLFDHQLLRLKGDLQQYYEFDDVWVSYVIDALLGWEIRRLPFPLPVDIANLDDALYNVMIFPSLPPGQVEKLLRLHRDMAGKMKAVATFSGRAKSLKTKMFVDMQRHFWWDVVRSTDLPRTGKSSYDALDSNNPIGLMPFLPSKPPNKPKRAFVCITGQFERLELQNKIDYLLRPMIDKGFAVQVALVLSGGGTTFTNADLAKLSAYRPKEQAPFFTSFPDAVDLLQKNGVNVISPKDAESGLYEKLADPKIHRQYLISLYEIQKESRSFESQQERVRNHARVYESYGRCLAHAENAVANANEKAIRKDPEWVHNPHTLQTYYRVVFRIRDDVGFQAKLSNKLVSSLMEPPPRSVTVTGCRGWHGMNDRFAIVSSDVARAYFQRPYELFSKEEELRDHVVINSETFLLYSYLTAGIHVYANQKLTGIARIYQDPKTGNATFYSDDLERTRCMTPSYTDRVVELYGKDIVGWTRK